MKRRDAIKTLMVATGGVFTFPAWAFRWSAGEIPDYKDTFTKEELTLMSAIADTIIPSNGKIGALSVQVDKYLAGLISECYDEEFQADIKKNLKKLEASAQKAEGISFDSCNQADREKLLLELKEGDENEEAFFEFMKSQTIRGFETSKEVMVEYHDYVMMPGFYDGDVDVEA